MDQSSIVTLAQFIALLSGACFLLFIVVFVTGYALYRGLCTVTAKPVRWQPGLRFVFSMCAWPGASLALFLYPNLLLLLGVALFLCVCSFLPPDLFDGERNREREESDYTGTFSDEEGTPGMYTTEGGFTRTLNEYVAITDTDGH